MKIQYFLIELEEIFHNMTFKNENIDENRVEAEENIESSIDDV
jgi:hypothetical protein